MPRPLSAEAIAADQREAAHARSGESQIARSLRMKRWSPTSRTISPFVHHVRGLRDPRTSAGPDSLYNVNRLAPHWPRGVPRDDVRGRVAKEKQCAGE